MTPELEACARRYLREYGTDCVGMSTKELHAQFDRIGDAHGALLMELQRALADADAQRAAEAALSDPRERA